MKKMIVIFILLLGILTGCSSDSDYIETVKGITFDDGKSVEEIVNEKVLIGNFYSENELDEILANPMNIFLFSMNHKEVIKKGFKDAGIKMPISSKIKWEVEGETREGKILTASDEKVKVKITARKNGDYIELYTTDIQLHIKKNNRVISDEMFERIDALYELARESGYTGIEEKKVENISTETNMFNEKAVLENKEGIYTVEYYPSGRVKFLTDSYLEIAMDDKNNLKEIEKSLKELDECIGKPEYSEETVNILVDFSLEIEYRIIAEKLNKKITKGEKKDIAELEKKAIKVFDKLQKEVDKIINKMNN